MGQLRDKDSPDDYAWLASDEQRALCGWIRTHIQPARMVYQVSSSYGLKHLYAAHGGGYVTNGQFKGAMRACGYEPVDYDEQNWRYSIKPAYRNSLDPVRR